MSTDDVVTRIAAVSDMVAANVQSFLDDLGPCVNTLNAMLLADYGRPPQETKESNGH